MAGTQQPHRRRTTRITGALIGMGAMATGTVVPLAFASQPASATTVNLRLATIAREGNIVSSLDTLLAKLANDGSSTVDAVLSRLAGTAKNLEVQLEALLGHLKLSPTTNAAAITAGGNALSSLQTLLAELANQTSSTVDAILSQLAGQTKNLQVELQALFAALTHHG